MQHTVNHIVSERDLVTIASLHQANELPLQYQGVTYVQPERLNMVVASTQAQSSATSDNASS